MISGDYYQFAISFCAFLFVLEFSVESNISFVNVSGIGTIVDVHFGPSMVLYPITSSVCPIKNHSNRFALPTKVLRLIDYYP